MGAWTSLHDLVNCSCSCMEVIANLYNIMLRRKTAKQLMLKTRFIFYFGLFTKMLENCITNVPVDLNMFHF